MIYCETVIVGAANVNLWDADHEQYKLLLKVLKTTKLRSMRHSAIIARDLNPFG